MEMKIKLLVDDAPKCKIMQLDKDHYFTRGNQCYILWHLSPKSSFCVAHDWRDSSASHESWARAGLGDRALLLTSQGV